MAVQISMPLCKGKPNVSLEKLGEYFNLTWAEEITFQEKKIVDNTFAFNIKKTLIAIGAIEAPIPWSDLDGPCATSILWPSATEEVKSHDQHLIVTVSDDELSPIDLSNLLTKVTAAILSTCDEAIGVYWCNSTMVIPKDIFVEFSEKILPQGPPVHIWIDFRVGKGESSKSTGFTTGLEALGLMEIEALDTPETVPELRDRLTGLADYLLMNGPVIRNGDTVGEDENEFIKVIYGKSEFGYENEVMILKYEQAKVKISKLKFW